MKVLWWPLLCPVRGQSRAAALTFLFGRFGREHKVSMSSAHPHHLWGTWHCKNRVSVPPLNQIVDPTVKFRRDQGIPGSFGKPIESRSVILLIFLSDTELSVKNRISPNCVATEKKSPICVYEGSVTFWNWRPVFGVPDKKLPSVQPSCTHQLHIRAPATSHHFSLQGKIQP